MNDHRTQPWGRRPPDGQPTVPDSARPHEEGSGATSAIPGPSDTPGAAPAEPMPVAVGRYLIRQPLGRGGMGSVYLAYDPRLDRQVALKVPRFTPASGPQAVDRFLRE